MSNLNTHLLGLSEKNQPVLTHQLFGNTVAILLLAVAFSLVANSRPDASVNASFVSEQSCNYQANRTSYAFGCKSAKE